MSDEKELTASDNANQDVHQTDPARLKKEIKDDLGLETKKEREEK